MTAYVDLDDLPDRRPSRGQDSSNVLAALSRFLADVSLGQGSGLVSGDLTGDEDLIVCTDGLGLIKSIIRSVSYSEISFSR